MRGRLGPSFMCYVVFQCRSSLWRARLGAPNAGLATHGFNPPAPRGRGQQSANATDPTARCKVCAPRGRPRVLRSQVEVRAALHVSYAEPFGGAVRRFPSGDAEMPALSKLARRFAPGTEPSIPAVRRSTASLPAEKHAAGAGTPKTSSGGQSTRVLTETDFPAVEPM